MDPYNPPEYVGESIPVDEYQSSDEWLTHFWNNTLAPPIPQTLIVNSWDPALQPPIQPEPSLTFPSRSSTISSCSSSNVTPVEDATFARNPLSDETLFYTNDYGTKESSPTLANDTKNMPSEQATVTKIRCRFCKTASFNRQPDLTRHLNERHRCEHKECKEHLFQTPMELEEHEKQHGCVKYQCGSCGLDGQIKRFKRPDKLKNHFVTIHNALDKPAYDEFKCFEKTCTPCSHGGTFFATYSDMRRHNFLRHSPEGESCTVSKKNNASSSPSHLFQVQASSPSMPTKHFLERHSMPPSKRYKISDSHVSLSSFLPFVESLQIPIRMIDICGLVVNQRFSAVAKELKLMEVSVVFIRSSRVVRVCGGRESEDIGRAMSLLQPLLHSPSLEVDEAPSGTLMSFRRLRSKRLAEHANSTIEIFPVDKHQDQEAIETWKEYIQPKLSDLLSGLCFGGSYTVMLVRQKGDQNVFGPVIRFQSPSQSAGTRRAIRRKIKEICSRNGRQELTVQFSSGTAAQLVGSPLTIPDDDLPREIAHHARYFQRPGIGASIGMSYCKHTRATLGGYIMIGDETFMLTVAHLVRAARECKECHCSTSINNSLSSPAPVDVTELRSEFEIQLNELNELMRDVLPGEDEIDLLDMSWRATLSDEERRQVEVGAYFANFKSELTKRSEEYELGNLIDHSEDDELMRPKFTREGGEKIFYHRMDYALYETKMERRGKNKVRHRVGVELNVSDFEDEAANEYGTGVVVESWREFRGGEAVYYVGSFSGYREGTINPVPKEIKDRHGVSQEWFITTGTDIVYESNVQGDSGAWVISKDDDLLLGLLWGYSNYCLLFTPIKEIFAHILEKRGRNLQIQVAPFDPSRASPATPFAFVSGNTRRPRARSCFNVTPGKVRRAHLSKTGIDPAAPKPILCPDDSSDTESVTPASSRSQSRSASPAPSLISSTSSLSEPPSPPFLPFDFAYPIQRSDFKSHSEAIAPAVFSDDSYECGEDKVHALARQLAAIA